jgi:hypothetical protein
VPRESSAGKEQSTCAEDGLLTTSRSLTSGLSYSDGNALFTVSLIDFLVFANSFYSQSFG